MKPVAGQPVGDVRDTLRNMLWRTVRDAGAAGMSIDVLEATLPRWAPVTISQMANLLRRTGFLWRKTPRQGPFVVTEECRVPAGEEPRVGPGFAAEGAETDRVNDLCNAILAQVATAGPLGMAPDELVALVGQHPQRTIDTADLMVRNGSLIRPGLFKTGYALPPRKPGPDAVRIDGAYLAASVQITGPESRAVDGGALTAADVAACLQPTSIVDAGSVARFRCALDSDGALTIQSQGLNGTMPKEDVRRLVTYLGRFEDFGASS